jgi:hypothetical protein
MNTRIRYQDETLDEAQSLVSHAYRIPMRTVLLQAGSIWLVTRFMFIVLTYLTVSVVMVHTPGPPTPETLLGVWNHWDTGFFLSIAYYGYYSPVPTVFYPLYPILIHAAASVAGYHYQLLAAVLISNIGTLFAFIGLGALVAQEESAEKAVGDSIRAVASYPLAFFLATPYSEGVFLPLATWTLVYMRRGAWYRAAACAFFAALTRPTGVILILPLLWECGRQYGWWQALALRWHTWRRHPDVEGDASAPPSRPSTSMSGLARALLAVAAVPLALGSFALYCYLRFHMPFSFVQSEQIYWLRHPMPPWQAIGVIVSELLSLHTGTSMQTRFLVDACILLLFCVLTLVSIRRTPFAFTLYMCGLLYLCIATPVINGGYPFALTSVSRFLVASIPIFLLLGRAIRRRPWLDVLVISGGFMLQGLFTVLYLQGLSSWI